MTSTSLSPKPFSTDIANICQIVLNYIYIVLLVVQLIIAMGNRPQGFKWAYTLIMVFFALLMAYIMFCTVWITVVGLTTAIDVASVSNDKFLALLSQNSFRMVIISIISTYVMYFVASLLFLDPWHMFTGLIPYIFMSPSYTNVLSIYAFCNTHDVSWGTKGDNSVADLGAVNASKDKDGNHTAEVEVPSEQKDLNELYEIACQDVKQKVKAEVQHRDAKTKQEDYYKAFRTRLVVAWVISNLALIAVITNGQIMLNWFGSYEQRSTAYLGFILWSVAGLAAVRFVGAVLYLILKIFTG